jgi:hypothetical protein
MTILALQLNSIPFKRPVKGSLTGFFVEAYLTSNPLPDLLLSVSRLSLILQDTCNVQLQIPATSDTITDMLAMGATAQIKFKLYFKNALNINYLIMYQLLSVHDFRYDLGPQSVTVTLTSKTDIVLSAAAAKEIKYFTKKRLSAPSTSYIYTVDPTTYLYYTLGTPVVDGALSLKVTRSTLSLVGNGNANLTIEAAPV